MASNPSIERTAKITLRVLSSAAHVLALAFAAALVPAFVFVAYDVLAFQSRKAEISALLAAATPEEQSLPPQVARLVELSLHGRLSAHAGSLLVGALDVPWVAQGQLGWHATSALWWAGTAIHLSRQEQLAIASSLAHTGNPRRGFSAQSEVRFHRQLSALTLAQAAMVVATSQAPSDASPERLLLRRDRLVEAYNRGT